MPDSWNFTQRPRRDDTASTGPPFTTWMLILISVLATCASSFPDSVSGAVWYGLGHDLAGNPIDIWSGKYYQMLTTVFVHADLVHSNLGFTHILFNMWWLLILGTLVESSCGPIVYICFCAAAAAIGSAAEMLWDGVPGIGMSGVVYALFGLMWASKGRFPAWDAVATRGNLQYLVMWGIFCIVATYSGWFQVANAAHFSGLLFGLAAGYAFFAPRRRPAWIAVLVLLAVMTFMAATWVPWNPVWQALHGSPALAQP